jgi:hypothetical protein
MVEGGFDLASNQDQLGTGSARRGDRVVMNEDSGERLSRSLYFDAHGHTHVSNCHLSSSSHSHCLC